MPITPTEQSRAVCLALPEIGWKEGKKCKGSESRYVIEKCRRCGAPQIGNDSVMVGRECYSKTRAHNIPPPDLASPAGADALMTALKSVCIIGPFIWQDENEIVCRLERYEEPDAVESPKPIEGLGPNWRLALLDAAYQLLCARE